MKENAVFYITATCYRHHNYIKIKMSGKPGQIAGKLSVLSFSQHPHILAQDLSQRGSFRSFQDLHIQRLNP